MADSDEKKVHPFRGRTADAHDPHRDWTVQKRVDGHQAAFPAVDDRPRRRFHPAELPDRETLETAGFNTDDVQGWEIPDGLVSDDPADATLPPSGNYPVDHPAREAHRGKTPVAEMIEARPEYDEPDEQPSANTPAANAPKGLASGAQDERSDADEDRGDKEATVGLSGSSDSASA